MKTKFFFLLAVLAFALVPAGLFAQTAQETASGSATILVPISIHKDADLNFGSMTPGTNGGTCVLTTGTSREKTGDITLTGAAPTPANAAFTVGGQAGAAYTITLPGSLVVSNGTDNMTIGTFVAKALSKTADGTVGQLSGTGADTFVVGATLTVGAAQPQGLYKADFNVSVTYN
jgi:hypothetical protein